MNEYTCVLCDVGGADLTDGRDAWHRSCLLQTAQMQGEETDYFLAHPGLWPRREVVSSSGTNAPVDVDVPPRMEPQRVDRWDQPDEVFRDLVRYHVERENLTRGQAARYVRLVARLAELTDTTCVEVLRSLEEVAPR